MRLSIAKKILLILVVAALVAMVFVLPLGTNGIAFADSFGGKEYNTFWYYDTLGLEEAKQIVATWDLSKVTNPIVISSRSR